MPERDKVLTTFQAADYCHVSPFTIRNWVEAGVLPAYRTPGGHRRIVKQDLDEFLRKHGMPCGEVLNQSHGKVLVVDDDEKTFDLACKVIAQIDGKAEVSAASDVFEAGALLTSLRPDVVVLDLKMPGLDGFQVCEKIKRDRTNTDCTVIGLTGQLSPEYESRFRSCGGLKLLKKPLDVDAMRDVIGEALARSRASGRKSVKA